MIRGTTTFAPSERAENDRTAVLLVAVIQIGGTLFCQRNVY